MGSPWLQAIKSAFAFHTQNRPKPPVSGRFCSNQEAFAVKLAVKTQLAHSLRTKAENWIQRVNFNDCQTDGPEAPLNPGVLRVGASRSDGFGARAGSSVRCSDRLC